MTQTIEQLTARVRKLETQLAANNPLLDEAANRIDELEEENARLKAECDDIKQIQFPRKLEAVAVGWKKRLAAEQLNNKMLREALKAVIKVHGYESGIPVEAISTQASTEALDKYAAEKVKELEAELTAAYKSIDDNWTSHQKIVEANRQRDLAVEALKHVRNVLPNALWADDSKRMIDATIKESDGK